MNHPLQPIAAAFFPFNSRSFSSADAGIRFAGTSVKRICSSLGFGGVLPEPGIQVARHSCVPSPPSLSIFQMASFSSLSAPIKNAELILFIYLFFPKEGV